LGQRADIKQLLGRTNDSADKARTQLTADLERRVRFAVEPFGSLRPTLHEGLDELIRAGDLKEEHLSRINARFAEISQQWGAAPDGPEARWKAELKEFDREARNYLRVALDEGVPGRQRLLAVEPLRVNLSPEAIRRRSSLDAFKVAQSLAAVLGVAAPTAGGTAWLLTSLSLTAIAGPVGAALAGAAALGLGAAFLRSRESALDKARGERITQLDTQADAAKTLFEQAALQQGMMIVDAVADYVSDYRNRLHAAYQQINDRISEPDFIKTQELITRLDPFDHQAQNILTELEALL
jgi:hypothetical protein